MKRRRLIIQLMLLSAGLLFLMLFIRLEPLFQLIPVILLLLAAMVLVVLEKIKKDKAAYKKIRK